MRSSKRQRYSILAFLVALLMFLVPCSLLLAQEAKRSEEDVARQLQNPLTSLGLLGSHHSGFHSIQDHYGPDPGFLSVKRISSASVGMSWATPVLSPVYVSKNTSENFGVRNMSLSALVTPVDSPTITWGLGPALSFPGSNSSIRNDRWGGGASGAVVYSLKAWVGGVFISNMWSFEGSPQNRPTNELIFQPFLNYNLSKGWYLTSTPAISLNLQTNGKDAWTVPVGGGVGKVVSVYGQTLNISTQGYVYPVHPTPGSGWVVQTTLQWLFPK